MFKPLVSVRLELVMASSQKVASPLAGLDWRCSPRPLRPVAHHRRRRLGGCGQGRLVLLVVVRFGVEIRECGGEGITDFRPQRLRRGTSQIDFATIEGCRERLFSAVLKTPFITSLSKIPGSWLAPMISPQRGACRVLHHGADIKMGAGFGG